MANTPCDNCGTSTDPVSYLVKRDDGDDEEYCTMCYLSEGLLAVLGNKYRRIDGVFR